MGKARYISLKDRIEPKGPRYQILHTCNGVEISKTEYPPGMFWKAVRELERKSARWALGDHRIELRLRTTVPEKALAEIDAVIKQYREDNPREAESLPSHAMDMLEEMMHGELGEILYEAFKVLTKGGVEPTMLELAAKAVEIAKAWELARGARPLTRLVIEKSVDGMKANGRQSGH